MRKAGWLLAIVLVSLGALSSAQGFRNAVKGGSQDFQWSVSRHLLKHENPYRLLREYQAGRLENKPFLADETPVYPASAEIFLWPVAALQFGHAKWVWAAANVLFAIGCVVLIARMAGASGVLALGLLGLFLAGTPVRTTIGNGQQGLFSFFCFILAIDLQQKKRTPLAALSLAASWLKYTITFPLSLVFIRREWRATFAIAAAIHVGLTLFLAYWTGENPLNLILGPMMLAGNARSANMFDVMAIAKYVGVASLIGPAFVGIALCTAVAVLMIKSKNDLIANLSLLSLVSLVWCYHWQYDYFILIIPLVYSLKHWQQGTTGVEDVLIAFSTLLVWFVQRVLDGAVSWFPDNASIAFARQIMFWVACLIIYIVLAIYFAGASRKARFRLVVPTTPNASSSR
jgi:hypothetical protein